MAWRSIDRRMFLGAAGATLAAIPWTAFSGSTAAAAPASNGKSSASPMDFDAAGDGATDDRAAVMAAFNYALERGLPIDGGDRSFGVRGSVAISNRTRPHIQQLRLQQLDPAPGRVTLQFEGCQNIQIDRLDINVGKASRIGDMESTFGLLVHGGSGHSISNVAATGDGKLTYVSFWNCRNSTFENIVVHDGYHSDNSIDPSVGFRGIDDAVQGIHLADCYRCSLINPVVYNLTGDATYLTQSGYNAANPRSSLMKPFPNMRTRGIAAGGNVDITIVNPIVSNVEQAMDCSGGGNNWGNRNIQIMGGQLINCGSVGVEFANAPNGCKAIGTTVRNVGMYGFLMTGQTTSYQGLDSSFIDCECINPGYNDIQFDTDVEGAGVPAYCGFYLASLPGTNDGGLIGGLVKDCRAIDRQGFYLAGDDSPWALVGATSATMAEPWTGYSGTYPDGVFTTSAGAETRTITLTNGSTVVSWTGGLAGKITHPFVKRPAAMQYGALCEAPYVVGSLKPNMCEGLLSVGHVKAAQKGFQRYSCSLKGSSVETIPTNANTAVLWDVEVEDTMGMHAYPSHRSWVVCPTSGIYRVHGFLSFAASAKGGYRRAQVKLDDVMQATFAYEDVQGEDTVVPFEVDVLATAGQHVEVFAAQNSGFGIGLKKSDSRVTVELIRAT